VKQEVNSISIDLCKFYRTGLNQNIQQTFKQRTNMGIEEAILKEVEERGILKSKIQGIRKALERGKLTKQEIAEDFEVSFDFVRQVEKG